VRHEALHYRVEVKDLRRRAVAAAWRSWGQPEPGDAGEGGKQPRQRRDGSVLPDGPGPASKTGRCTRGTSVLTLLKSPASSNPVDLGWSAMRTNTYVLGTPWLVKVAGRGGHGECLRRSRGDIAGA